MFAVLRRNFIAGFFVTVPLVISVGALLWIFRLIDGLVRPVYEAWLPFPVPGLGLLMTALVVLLVGTIATNVIGKRLLQRAESYLTRVPVFRTIYAPVKQLVVAFSPDNEYGFKRVALVEDAARGFMLGFLTKEFTVDRGQGSETLLAIYVPTNHLYLGDVIICARDKVTYPDITVEQGIRIFLTGGMALPGRLRLHSGEKAIDSGDERRRLARSRQTRHGSEDLKSAGDKTTGDEWCLATCRKGASVVWYDACFSAGGPPPFHGLWNARTHSQLRPR